MPFDCLVCFNIEKISLPEEENKLYIDIEHEQTLHKQVFPSENTPMISYLKDAFVSNNDEVFEITITKRTQRKIYVVAKGKITLFYEPVISGGVFYFEKLVSLNCSGKRKGKMLVKAVILDPPQNNNIVSAENKFLVDFNYNQAKLKLLTVLSDPLNNIGSFTRHLDKEVDNYNKRNNTLRKEKTRYVETKEEDFLPEKHDDSFLNDLSFLSMSYDSDDDIAEGYENQEDSQGMQGSQGITSDYELQRKKLKILDNILLNPRTKVDLDLEKR